MGQVQQGVTPSREQSQLPADFIPVRITQDGSSFPASVPTLETPPTTVINGKTSVTTAGTRVQLPTNTCKSIVLKALATNAGTIYVGSSSVAAANGFQLAAGDSVALDINNTNVVYIDASTNGEGVTWLAIN